MTCADNCTDEAPTERPSLSKSPQVRASALAWVFIVVGLVARWADAPDTLQVAAFAVAIVAGSFYFAREAVEELWKEREVGIELLMTLAIAAAAALGNWREGALVAGLYSISEALEGFTIQRTRHAIRALMSLVPPKARVLKNGEEVEVDVEAVQVGDRLVVRPGESIPTDGVIREGASAINEAAVTGESMPVEREAGANVFAGTINGNGALIIEASRTFKDNTVSKIIELVERAQRQKGQSQLLVERFAKYYSPAVLLASVLVAVVPLLVGAADPLAWVTRAASLLVAAAPCALAVATPVTLVAAIGSAAKRGVLIKGGNIVEQLGKISAIAIDKTGTLTEGKPRVVGVHAVGRTADDVLGLAASVEHFSEHPLGEAIVKAARDKALSLRPSADFKALTAAGVEAVVDGKGVAVLRPSAAQARGISFAESTESWRTAEQDRGESVVAVVEDGAMVGLIALADTARREAPSLVASLKRIGVRHVVMLTGDNAGTAKVIAAQVGVEEYYAGLLPEEKVHKVEELVSKYGKVAMVGDGINDAPALARSTVGIAMGTGGSDAALAAADVALIGDDLSKLQYAIRLGRRSERVIMQNIVVSLLIVAALVIGTFVADLSMFGAVVGHEGSEVLIILNGLRVALRD
jgi:heavy metal translocating P-type ATPase